MGDQRYVVVRLDGDLFALRIGSVERILPGRLCHHGDRPLMGIATVMGEPVTAIDLRSRLSYEPTLRPGSWVVVNTEGHKMALKVDGVDGILTFSDLDIEANPAASVVSGVARNGYDRVSILEADRLAA